jgi:hypothetical protein
MLLSIALLFAFLPPAFSLGDTLPVLKGEFLDGRSAELPVLAQGKVTLLVLGFSRDAQAAVEGWTKRFRADFEADRQVRFYEIRMVGGLKVMAKPLIEGGIRKDTQGEDYEHVITVFGGAKFWKDRLRFRNGKDAYLILLGQEGAIRWVGHGFISEAKYGEMAAQVRRLLGK